MVKPGGMGGMFAILRITQYMPYVAIGLLVAMIVLWVIFGKKKLRWAKISAIVLTVLVLITGLLSLTPYIMGTGTSRGLPEGEFPEGEFPEGGLEEGFPEDSEGQFKDFRDREESQNSSSLYLPEVIPENSLTVI